MTGIPRASTAIVGAAVGGMGNGEGRTSLEILSEAVHKVLEDAGMKLGDVDGLFTGSSFHYMATLSTAEYLGIQPRFSDSNMVGGASFHSQLIPAALALNAGLIDVALICFGSNQGMGEFGSSQLF